MGIILGWGYIANPSQILVGTNIVPLPKNAAHAYLGCQSKISTIDCVLHFILIFQVTDSSVGRATDFETCGPRFKYLRR